MKQLIPGSTTRKEKLRSSASFCPAADEENTCLGLPLTIIFLWLINLDLNLCLSMPSAPLSLFQGGHVVMTVAISACGPPWGSTRQRGTGSHSSTARSVPLTRGHYVYHTKSYSKVITLEVLQWWFISFLIVAVCALPVFWGASFCPGLSAQRPGLPSHAAALSEHGATPEPHVPHHQRLLSGEINWKNT